MPNQTNRTRRSRKHEAASKPERDTPRQANRLKRLRKLITATPFKLLFTLEEAAAVLGVSTRTVMNLRYANLLPVCHIGRRVLIHKEDLEAVSRGARASATSTKLRLVPKKIGLAVLKQPTPLPVPENIDCGKKISKPRRQER